MNKWRFSANTNLTMLTRDVVTQLENYEKYFGLRKRARRPADQQTFALCVEALVCDLIHRALTSEDGKGRIAVSMDRTIKASRYKAPCDSKQFPHVVNLMSTPEMGFLEVCELGGWQIGKRTAVRAAPRLLDWIDSYGVELEDMEIRGDQEIVIQKRGKHDPHNTVDGRAEWIDYPESNIAKKYRREVRTINDWWREQRITYTGDRLVDLTDKRVRRYFNNASFKQGGRLFGGFWQNLKSRQVSLVEINGEKIAEVDFETMQIAIARAAVGVPHEPDTDAYDFYFLDTKPGEEPFPWKSETLRKGIKKVTASMLFATRPLKNWPQNTQCHFPPGTKLKWVTAAIERAFPELAGEWNRGRGFNHMFTESQVLVKVLLRLKDAGIVALPKHDCVLVPASQAHRTARIMRETFEELTGGPVAVTVNGSKLRAVA